MLCKQCSPDGSGWTIHVNLNLICHRYTQPSAGINLVLGDVARDVGLGSAKSPYVEVGLIVLHQWLGMGANHNGVGYSIVVSRLLARVLDSCGTCWFPYAILEVTVKDCMALCSR